MTELLTGGRLVEPVAYSRGWLVLAVALPLLMVLYYAAVTWWTRPPRAAAPPAPPSLDAVRAAHLARLDALEAAVRDGAVGPRQAHQEVSRVVRSFLSSAGPVDALTMTLDELRAAAPRPVVDLVALVYPPSFAPGDQGRPHERLAPALHDARQVVTAWSP